MKTPTLQEALAQAWNIALQADDAWQAELTRQFGKYAGDMRYLEAGEGEPCSELRRCYLDFRMSRDHWMMLYEKAQKEIESHVEHNRRINIMARVCLDDA